ncbi:hypothetical protein [Luteimonas salinilitoris]|uniref:Uncharacterized protein n=1 Tax=Luteimonas salinilitoris TaxID=3237697 RepID=A0ABV4HYE1_9GAMM
MTPLVIQTVAKRSARGIVRCSKAIRTVAVTVGVACDLMDPESI